MAQNFFFVFSWREGLVSNLSLTLDIKGNIIQQEKRCGTLEITAMPKRGDMVKRKRKMR